MSDEMEKQSSNPILETLTLYRDAVRRHEKFTLYDHSQPAGPDLGYDQMVDWASETDHAFVEHVKQLHAQLAECDAFIERLIEAGNDVSLLEFSVERFEKWHALVREWKEGHK